MSENSYKTIRNGVIASVIAGVILLFIPVVREYFLIALKWIWSGIVWCWSSIFISYSFSGWFLLILFGLAFIGILSIYFSFQRYFEQPEHNEYTSDTIFGMKWRWYWKGHSIRNLWCFCPNCDATLVYDDSSCRRFSGESATHYICENCASNRVGSITGGNKSYAEGAVKREIDRRIRTGQYKH